MSGISSNPQERPTAANPSSDARNLIDSDEYLNKAIPKNGDSITASSSLQTAFKHIRNIGNHLTQFLSNIGTFFSNTFTPKTDSLDRSLRGAPSDRDANTDLSGSSDLSYLLDSSSASDLSYLSDLTESIGSIPVKSEPTVQARNDFSISEKINLLEGELKVFGIRNPINSERLKHIIENNDLTIENLAPFHYLLSEAQALLIDQNTKSESLNDVLDFLFKNIYGE